MNQYLYGEFNELDETGILVKVTGDYTILSIEGMKLVNRKPIRIKKGDIV